MKKIESGRSMVEMLGVLAIIGVLSIGGIAGYTMAMNRYRANEIIDVASKLSVVAQTKGINQTYVEPTLDEIGVSANNIHNATFTTLENGQVTMAGTVTDGVKKAVKSIAGSDTIIIKGNN